MIVCSCNVISRTDIEDVILEFLHDDPWQLITPGRVYRVMTQRGKCCGCFPQVIDIIVETITAYHREMNSSEAQIIDLMARLQEERSKTEILRTKPVRTLYNLQKASA